MVLPHSVQKQFSLIKLSWSSLQPRLASVMNVKFCGINFHGRAPTCEITKVFNLENVKLYGIIYISGVRSIRDYLHVLL